MKRRPAADESYEPRPTLHAALYGLHLRENEALSRDEAARRVIARYPHTAPLLSRLANVGESDNNWPGTRINRPVE